MRLGIMQPYFLPYIGYFQLLNYCDTFVLYDDVEYSKKGWINRNRIQQDGEIRLFSLSLKKASDYSTIKARLLSENFDRSKLLRTFESAYRKAPHFDELINFLGPIVSFESNNLFSYLENSISVVGEHLGVNTKLIKSSELDIDPKFRGQERVLEICNLLKAEQYINPVGGLNLYDVDSFKSRGLDLKFIKSRLTPYFQGDFDFIPALSIIDQIAFSGSSEITQTLVSDYDLL